MGRPGAPSAASIASPAAAAGRLAASQRGTSQRGRIEASPRRRIETAACQINLGENEPETSGSFSIRVSSPLAVSTLVCIARSISLLAARAYTRPVLLLGIPPIKRSAERWNGSTALV